MTEPNNLSQQKTISIVESTTFPDRNYLISKIHGVLSYSFDRHKITKLENHEDKEITVEQLVNQYYKDPDRYFEVDNSKAAPPSTNYGGDIAISRTIELAKPLYLPLEIKNNNIKKEGVRNDYSLDVKNRGKLQQILEVDIKSAQNEQEQSTKLFDLPSSNNLFI